MASPKKKKSPNAIFESIRKPTAPPSKKFGDEKPEQKVHPARRKSKHKRKATEEES
jgi:hypothetical protein